MRLLYIGPEEMRDVVEGKLSENFDVLYARNELEVDQLIDSAEVILDANISIEFSGTRLEKAQNLKLYVCASTGTNHVDGDFLSHRGITLHSLREEQEFLRNITPTSEHAWLLLMACARKLLGASRDVRNGNWIRAHYPGILLRGKKLGVIGCGRIGQWLSHYGLAFGLTCFGYDPYINTWPEGIQKSSLEFLLGQSDFISIHVPLTASTRHLLGPKEFEFIKRGAILINTSRGDVIDESCLLRALLDQQLYAAGVDVLTGEPHIANHPLVEYARNHDNLIITPHIAGFSLEVLEVVLVYFCEKIRKFTETQLWKK